MTKPVVKRILVPIDFSEPSQYALWYACDLARAHDAHIDLLHVIEAPTFPSFYQIGAVALYGQVPDLEARARGALARLITEAEHPRPPMALHVAHGHPVKEILAFVHAHEIDLVVIATRGLGRVSHFLLGSVAEKVVRRAACPVLVVRQEQEASGYEAVETTHAFA